MGKKCEDCLFEVFIYFLSFHQFSFDLGLITAKWRRRNKKENETTAPKIFVFNWNMKVLYFFVKKQ